MKPFQNTALLRPLTIEELRLEDPEWVDDHTITFYIPCWFHVDSVFAGIHVETDQNDDYINLYCIYDTRVQSVRLSMIYVNNSAKNGEQDFELVLRVLICDPDGKYPWEDGCDPGYAAQLSGGEKREMARIYQQRYCQIQN